MTTGTIVKWDAPNEASLSGCAVRDCGAVVCVRIAPQGTGGAPLGPAADGSCPRIYYVPTREPDGTGAFQQVDARSLETGEVVGRRPRVRVNESFSDKKNTYAIDIGVPFVCPWPGIFRIGGGNAGGLASPQDVSIVISEPVLDGATTEVCDMTASSLSESYPFTRYRELGARPKSPPTLTFRNITTTPIAIPYGAIGVQVWTTTTVRFKDPAGAADDVTITGGPPVRLGAYALGTTFELPPGGASPATPIQRIVFILEIA